MSFGFISKKYNYCKGSNNNLILYFDEIELSGCKIIPIFDYQKDCNKEKFAYKIVGEDSWQQFKNTVRVAKLAHNEVKHILSKENI